MKKLSIFMFILFSATSFIANASDDVSESLINMREVATHNAETIQGNDVSAKLIKLREAAMSKLLNAKVIFTPTSGVCEDIGFSGEKELVFGTQWLNIKKDNEHGIWLKKIEGQRIYGIIHGEMLDVLIDASDERLNSTYMISELDLRNNKFSYYSVMSFSVENPVKCEASIEFIDKDEKRVLLTLLDLSVQ